MSETTLQIPAERIEAIRQSLVRQRDEAERKGEIDRLLGQIESQAPGRRPSVLTGSHAVLWSAAYDALCVAADQLADDCNEYWRGEIAPADARSGVLAVGAWIELLTGLGFPPGATRSD